MGSWSDTSGSDGKAKKSSPVTRRPNSNYRVRFRHGVYPNAEGEATRADFKKYDYFFGGGQTWVGVPGNVDFLDETAQVAADLESAEQGKSTEGSRRRPARRLVRTRTAERILQVGKGRATELSIRPASYVVSSHAFSSGAPSTASSSPRQTVFQHRRYTSPAPSSISSLDGSSSLDWQYDAPTSAGPFTSTHTTRVPWPLSDPEEAHLFRFFVDTAAPWWDITSSQSVFKEVVPQLALSNSMLLNVIFMIASQHIGRYDTTFPAKPYLYHERVLQQLIPYLSDNGRIQDEATLVAAVLLRGFEECHAGTRGQYHLSTYELFHGPDGWLFNMSSPVVQACFMVHVHFEIYQGLLDPSNLRLDYRAYILPTLAIPLDDIAWHNRIVWICARIIQWAESDSRTMGEWHRLKETVDDWERERPSSFNAFFYREADLQEGRHLPELWFPNRSHADAHQYLRICRIALEMNHPDTRSGQNQETEDAREIEVTMWLKEMVAVARCNPHAVSAPSIAAHAIHKFAVGIRDPIDQSYVMEFLEEVEGMGWSTESTRKWLRVQWGWLLQDNADLSNEEFL